SVCFMPVRVLYSVFGSFLGNSTPGSTHGSALRYLRERPVRREYDQPRSQADQTAVASESGLDARPGQRKGATRPRLHPLPQGGESHEGHLSTRTNGRGRWPPPEWSMVGGRHPPPAEIPSLTSSSSWPSSSSSVSPPLT